MCASSVFGTLGSLTIYGENEFDTRVESSIDGLAPPDTRDKPSYDMDIIVFHAFLNMIMDYAQDYYSNTRDFGPSLYVGAGAVAKSVDRLSTEVRKKSVLAFSGAQKAPRKHTLPFIKEFLVLNHPRLREDPHIVNLVGLEWELEDHGNFEYLTEIRPVLSIEYADHGNLSSFLEQHKIGESLRLRYAFCSHSALGIAALHTCDVIHGDLKPENILIFTADTPLGFVAKVCDFSHSIIHKNWDDSPATLPGGSFPWPAPEWKERRRTSELKLCDVYSLGLLVWGCFSTAGRPFGSEHRQEIVENFKVRDEAYEMACSSTTATLKSLSRPELNSNQINLLGDSLVQIFEFTLSVNHELRSLTKLLTIFESATSVLGIIESKKSIPEAKAYWEPMYFVPRPTLVQSDDIKSLMGNFYCQIQGSLGVATASVAICRHVYSKPGVYTPVARSDAAIFLFRCYLEGYGISQGTSDRDQALEWLLNALEAESKNEGEVASWIGNIDNILTRLDYNFPDKSQVGGLLRRLLKQALSKGYTISRKAIDTWVHLYVPDITSILAEYRKHGILDHVSLANEVRDILVNQQAEKLELSTVDPTKRLSSTGYRLIHVAASCGDLAFCQILHDKYDVDVNIKNDFGFTALLLALRYAHAEMVSWLIEHGATADSTSHPWSSILQHVVLFECTECKRICEQLISAGANVDHFVWLRTGKYSKMNFLSFAIVYCNLDMVEIILALNPSLDSCKASLGWAAHRGNYRAMRMIRQYMLSRFQVESTQEEMLQYFVLALGWGSEFCRIWSIAKTEAYEEFLGFLYDDLDSMPEHVIYWGFQSGVARNDVQCLSTLMEKVDLKTLWHRQNSWRRGLVELSVIYDKKSICDFLISRGAPVQPKQVEGLFPTILHVIAQRELIHSQYFCKLMLQYGEDINTLTSPTQGRATPITIASFYQNYPVVDCLLQSGCALDIYDGDRHESCLQDLVGEGSGDAAPMIKYILNNAYTKPSFIINPQAHRSLIHDAVYTGFTKGHMWRNTSALIKGPKSNLDALLDYYYKPEFINCRTISGHTALHFAASGGCVWAVESLLNAGADPRLCSSDGRSPIHLTFPFWTSLLYLFTFVPHPKGSGARSIDEDGQIAFPLSSYKGRTECRRLLFNTEGRPMVADLSIGRKVLGTLRLMDLSKGDDEAYHAWEGEFNTKISRLIVWMRNKLHERRWASLSQNKSMNHTGGKDIDDLPKRPAWPFGLTPISTTVPVFCVATPILIFMLWRRNR